MHICIIRCSGYVHTVEVCIKVLFYAAILCDSVLEFDEKAGTNVLVHKHPSCNDPYSFVSYLTLCISAYHYGHVLKRSKTWEAKWQFSLSGEIKRFARNTTSNNEFFESKKMKIHFVIYKLILFLFSFPNWTRSFLETTTPIETRIS